MAAALKLKTQVLPGKRIEFTAPELPEGGEVELIVVLPDETTVGAPTFASAGEYLDSLPPLTRTPEEWARIERELATERDAWER